jgi:hypothetical protein
VQWCAVIHSIGIDVNALLDEEVYDLGVAIMNKFPSEPDEFKSANPFCRACATAIDPEARPS